MTILTDGVEIEFLPWRIHIKKLPNGRFDVHADPFILRNVPILQLYKAILPFISHNTQLNISLEMSGPDAKNIIKYLGDAIQQQRLLAGFTEPIFQHGIAYIYNIASNRRTYSWKRLKGSLAGATAVYCGGGPSIVRDIDLLKALKGKAVIIAGGHGLKRCLENGLVPDFCLAMDPYDTEQNIMKCDIPDTLPMVCTGALNPTVYKNWPGPLVRMPGDQSTDIWKLFEPEARPLRLGSGVSVWAAYVAEYMGIKNLYYSGVDLSDDTLETYIEKEGLKTTVTWENESIDIGAAIKNTGLKLVNTSKGLNIPGSINGDLPNPDQCVYKAMLMSPLIIDNRREDLKKRAAECRDVRDRIKQDNIIYSDIYKYLLESYYMMACFRKWKTHDMDWGLLRDCLMTHAHIMEDAAEGKEYPGEIDFINRNYREGNNIKATFRIV